MKRKEIEPMNANEMVNLLRVRAETQNKRGYSGEASELIEIADLIGSQAAEIDRLTERWIPVTERLPKEYERVFVLISNDTDIGYYNGKSWQSAYNDGWSVPATHVTHWMPLPAAPDTGNPASKGE